VNTGRLSRSTSLYEKGGCTWDFELQILLMNGRTVDMTRVILSSVEGTKKFQKAVVLAIYELVLLRLLE